MLNKDTKYAGRIKKGTYIAIYVFVKTISNILNSSACIEIDYKVDIMFI